MSNYSKQSIFLITLGCFFAFFSFGFIDNLRGPTISQIIQELNFTYIQGGTIIFIGYIGYVIATMMSGILSETIGKKAIILLATIALLVGVTIYSLLSDLWLLSIAMLLVGFGLGSIDLGAHSIIVDIHKESKGKFLNLLTFFYGTGAMIGPLYAGQLFRMNYTWREVYQFSLILVVIIFLYFIVIRYPKEKGKKDKTSIKSAKIDKSIFTKELCWYYFLIICYVGVEIGIGSWIVDFLQNVKSLSVDLSSLFLSLFFGAVMVGRFIGSLLVDRIGYLKSIFGVSIISTFCIAIGIFGPPSLVFFLPLSGLFLSIIFPTMVAAVSGVSPHKTGTILGLFFTFAGIGRMVGPWTIGIFSDLLGIKLGFSTILIFGILMIISVNVLMQKEKQNA